MYMKFNLKIIGILIILAIVILSLTLLFNYKNCKKCKKNIKEGMNVNGMVDENKNAYLDTMPSFLTFNTFGNSKTGKVTSDVVINKAAFVTDYYTPI